MFKQEFLLLIKCVFVITVQLDGTRSKQQLFNFVYGDILNNIQKSL